MNILGNKVRVCAFGRHHDGFRLDGPVDSLCEKVYSLVSELCPGKVPYVSNIAQASRIVLPSSAFTRVNVKNGYVQYHKNADGLCLLHGDALVMPTGDCPVVILTIPGEPKAVVVHAGRKSLIGESPEGLITRRGSVITHALRHFDSESRKKRMFAYVMLGIGKDSFLHNPHDPVWGKRNKKLLNHIKSLYGAQCINEDTGAISLHEIIQVQCLQSGLVEGSVRFDGVDTYSDRLYDGDFAWWSHRRGDQNRNIVIVSV
jgi:copper oxidase (laccase) domain-containing protein